MDSPSSLLSSAESRLSQPHLYRHEFSNLSSPQSRASLIKTPVWGLHPQSFTLSRPGVRPKCPSSVPNSVGFLDWLFLLILLFSRPRLQSPYSPTIPSLPPGSLPFQSLAPASLCPLVSCPPQMICIEHPYKRLYCLLGHIDPALEPSSV